jgi:hypothetical protein
VGDAARKSLNVVVALLEGCVRKKTKMNNYVILIEFIKKIISFQ